MIKYISKENKCVILLSINSLIFLYHFFKISDTFFFPGDFLRSNLQHSMSGFKMEQQYKMLEQSIYKARKNTPLIRRLSALYKSNLKMRRCDVKFTYYVDSVETQM